MNMISWASLGLAQGAGASVQLNDYINEIIGLLRTNASKDLDPMSVPPFVSEYNEKIVFIPIKTKVAFSNILIRGISTIVNNNNTIIAYKDKKLVLGVELAVPTLQFSGAFEAKLDSVGPSGTLDGSIADVNLQLSLNVDADALSLQITDLVINAGKMKVNVHWTKYLDWLLNGFVNFALKVLKSPILHAIADEIKNQVQFHFDSNPMPKSMVTNLMTNAQ